MAGRSVRTLPDPDRIERLEAEVFQAGMVNGWNKPEPSMWPLPKRHFVPAHWSYEKAKAFLDAAGELIGTDLAERRNLILASPIPDNFYPTVRTMVAAYQMVKAGETARSHRHTANALRFVLDAEPNAFTIVEGKRIPMEPGDVLLTPNWHWHGHSNESRAAAYWMDFLDMPLVHLLGPMFFEHHAEGLERVAPVDPGSPARFAWAETQRRLDAAPEIEPGRREIELGKPALVTISLHVTRLEAGRSFAAGPTTANSIFAVMEGAGVSTVDGKRYEWRRGDVVAVPTGYANSTSAGTRSTLLRVTDEPLLRHLDWLRTIPAGR
jgi:gentisate 1,2-dioxygenase